MKPNVMSFLLHRIGVRKVSRSVSGSLLDEQIYRPMDDMGKFLLEFSQADDLMPDDHYSEDLSCNEQGYFSPEQIDLLKAYGFEPYVPALEEKVI